MKKPDNMFEARTYGKHAALYVKRALLIAIATLAVMPLAAQSLSQRVNVSGMNSTVRELFNQIEAQTGYTFAFNKTALDVTRRVSVSANGVELRQVLDRILTGTGFTYIISNNHIIIVAGQGTAQARPETDQPRQAAPVRQYQPRPATAQRPATTTQPSQQASRQTAQRPSTAVRQDAPREEQTVQAPGWQQDSETRETTQRTVTPRAPRKAWVPTDPWLLPGSALKTNLLFDLTTTINLGVEVRLSPKTTVEMMTYYNSWNFKNNRKFKKIMVQPEFRYWFREAFTGHVLGFHAQYAHFNYGNLPIGNLEHTRFQGNMYGFGISYGYSWRLGQQKRLALEPTIGIGYNHLKYDSFECDHCGQPTRYGDKYNYFGVTKIGVNLSVLLGGERE